MRNKITHIFSVSLSFILIAYGLTILSILGTGGLFNFFWVAAGTALLVLTAVFEKLNRTLRKIVVALIAIGLSIFLLAEIQLVSVSLSQPAPDADYVIILGSHLRSSGPSVDFQGRLDKAYEYLSANENTVVITTGGQGTNEPKPEGEGGAEYLISKGISSGRILIEKESHTTAENMRNALKIIKDNGDDAEHCSVVIVSNTYHLLRAKLIAQKLGYGNISCTAGHGLRILDPHYFTREFFAIIKEWLTGAI